MSAKEIMQAALSSFAHDGYEGASLQKIADEVGIKKPSIYAHYKGKEDLFLHVTRHVFDTERMHILDYFARNRDKPVEQQLKQFFDWMLMEYDRSDRAKFLIRMTYYPPSELYDQIIEIVYPFLDSLQRHLVRLLQREKRSDRKNMSDAEEAAVAYVTMAEGAVIELVSGRKTSYQARTAASWAVYCRGVGLSMQQKQ